MRLTLEFWNPLLDRLVALWCETVDGGWPCRTWPADWAERRETWLADYAAATARHPYPTSRTRAKGNFARLRDSLERCPVDGSTLTGRDVGRIRQALAQEITRHGAPGSIGRVAVRASQADVLALPTHAALAGALVERLRQLPGDGGIDDPDLVRGPIGPDEAGFAPERTAIPEPLVDKALLAWDAPIATLVEHGVIVSGEVLAEVLPQVTAQSLAAGFDHPELGAFYGQAYAAFRRRRGLLLLNLEHQVRFEELPWVAALGPWRGAARGGSAEALRARDVRRAFEHATMLAFESFPQTMLPNPLVSELRTMAEAAQLKLPLVEEVAADIFMGTFTDKWRAAARIASDTMRGTLYARYHGLPEASFWVEEEQAAPMRRRGGLRRSIAKPTARRFAAECERRAAEARSGGGGAEYVAANGTVLEQSQILTTHNLAVLVDALDLRAQLEPIAPVLADRALAWALTRLCRPTGDVWLGRQAVRNAAYAWRQGIFFLSFCEPSAQAASVARLRERLAREPVKTQVRIGPALDGLGLVIGGGSFDENGRSVGAGLRGIGPGRRLLGWSVGAHWIL
jgi:hypothetical protein